MMQVLNCTNMFYNNTDRKYQDIDRRYQAMHERGIDIIVPVYQGLSETARCIHSVLKCTAFPFRLWLINDQSPESGMTELLQSFSADPRVHILNNSENLGFVATVNRGFEATAGDVVILNNDTEVYDHWLESLALTAAEHRNTATITPYSSNAGLFTLSIDDENGDFTDRQIADALHHISDNLSLQVPTGHGYCMFISREALDKVGHFDVKTFGKGYGEETDFCLRCSEQGFIHLLCSSAYIRHDQGISFSETREARIQESRKLLDARYPEYTQLLEDWKSGNEWRRKKAVLAQRVKQYISENPSRSIHPRKRLLVAMHEGKGGSVLNRFDLMRALSGEYDCFFLTSDWRTLKLSAVTEEGQVAVRNYKLNKTLSCDQLEREDLQNIYADILRRYRIDAVNCSHMLGHTFDLVKECRKLQLPCIYVHHDYYTVCPNFALINEEGACCEGNCCESLSKTCSVSPTWLSTIPHVSPDSVSVWRSVMSAYLPLFTHHCAPSEYCKRIVLNTYPELEGKIDAIEHGRDFEAGWNCESNYPQPGEKIRVLILGNIGKSKGLHFLNRLAAINTEDKIEFHILGNVHNKLNADGFVLHGEYTRDTLPERIKEIRPHYALIPSVFPETYCHTLTEAWKLNLPTLVFDIGVLRERMKKSNAGWILPIGDEKAVYALLTEGITEEEYNEKKNNIAAIHFRTTRDMALDYKKLFEAVPADMNDPVLQRQMFRSYFVAFGNPLWHTYHSKSARPANHTQAKEAKLQAELKRSEREIKKLEKDILLIRNCGKMQVGEALVDAVKHPLSAWKLPVKAFRFGRNVLVKRIKGKKKATDKKAKKEPAPSSVAQAESLSYSATTQVKTAAVIICVHNALDDFKKCIESVLENRTFPYEIILVNDGSDEETTAYISGFSSYPYIRTIHHKVSRGYTCAANAGLKATKADYAVLLNSDTVVTADWIEKMIDAFEKHPSVGILSPLSNAATYQSIPETKDSSGWCINTLPIGVNAEMMNLIVEHSADSSLPELRCVNGFCFMIRREVINRIGLLDDKKFPMGYGEEVDYCLRANEAGFTCNVLANTYIFHAKTKSFTTEKRKQLVQASKKLLADKHGKRYADLLSFLESADPLVAARSRIHQMINEQMPAIQKLRSKRIAFLLPTRSCSGGATSVCQEAMAWRKLGFNVTLINRKDYRDQFLSYYPEWARHSVWFDKSAEHLAHDFDLVIATTFFSVALMKKMLEENRELQTAYYIQDYEPLFCKEGTPTHKEAVASYELIPDMLSFAKTDWLCEKIHACHPSVTMHRVKPSVSRYHYNPHIIKKVSSPKAVKLVAMIRPSTPRRRPDETLEVFKALKQRLGKKVEISCFGCSDEELKKLPHAEGLDAVNLGVLKPGDVAKVLSQSDIFLDMSSYQAFGRTGIEGMALGCIPVLPAEGGVYEYAVHNENALILDTFNHKQVINEISRLIEHPQDIVRMKLAGLETVKRYSVMKAAWSEILLLSRNTVS